MGILENSIPLNQRTRFTKSLDAFRQKRDENNYRDKQDRQKQKNTARDFSIRERTNPSELWIQIRHITKEFFSKAMPYIVLCIFLYVVYSILTGGFGSSSSNEGNSVSELQRNAEILKNQFTGIFGSVYLYFYNIWLKITSFFRLPQPIRKLLAMYSQYRDGGPTVPRTTIDSGRCDNIQWIETTADGKQGSCDSAIRPRDLIWKLQPNLYNSEFKAESDFLKKHPNTSAYLNNLNIVIPWDKTPETTFFVPQCEQAYFANQCRSVSEEKCNDNEQYADGYCCVKANLLKEQGLTCGLKSFYLPVDEDANKNKVSKNNTQIPSFNNIQNFNKKKELEKNPTGSPTFVNIVSNKPSAITSSFINT